MGSMGCVALHRDCVVSSFQRWKSWQRYEEPPAVMKAVLQEGKPPPSLPVGPLTAPRISGTSSQ